MTFRFVTTCLRRREHSPVSVLGAQRAFILRSDERLFHFPRRLWFRCERAALDAHAARRYDARLRLHGAQEGRDFGVRKRAMVTGSERFKREISDCNAFNFFDRVSSLKKTIA